MRATAVPGLSDDWFTVEYIADGIFSISEYAHWQQPHAYVIPGRLRAAVVDTGLGVGDIKAVVNRITTRPVTVITTHTHWDHVGGHGGFSEIAVHVNDADWMREGIPVPAADLRHSLLHPPPTRPFPGFLVSGWTK